jgi:hypothetical protein
MASPFDNQDLAHYQMRAEELRGRDPQAACIARVLLEYERRSHATGWDGPNSHAEMFTITTGGRGRGAGARLFPDDEFNDLLREGARLGLNPADCLHEIADTYVEELTRARLGEPSPRASRAVPADYLERLTRGEDAMVFQDGAKLFGFGIRTEAFAVLRADVEGGDLDAFQAQVARSGELPAAQRRQARVVHFTGRDANEWTVLRFRGEKPMLLLADPDTHDANGAHGAAPNDLTRLLAAFTGTQLPLPKRPLDD